MRLMDNSEEIRKRIFERLHTSPQPADYRGNIPWTVQQQIAATNGIHFVNNIGKLEAYPIPEIPVDPAANPGKDLLLDIGCGWGRWLVASGRKNYIPIGIDIRHEFCVTARQVVKENGGAGYTVVADLQSLPFADEIFNVVWSFSVIQHTHYDRLIRCLRHIERILADHGYCFLEFPNKNGIRNRIGPAAGPNNMDFDSWDVRYYSPREYREIFEQFFDNFSYSNHSVLGIGILPGDLAYARGFKNKAIVAASRSLSRLAGTLPLKSIADSIYIKSVKHSGTASQGPGEQLQRFLQAHAANPGDNLNIIHLLSCPVSGRPVTVSETGSELICRNSGLSYPIKDGIPIMVREAAIPIPS
jgi:uncharacterized protein